MTLKVYATDETGNKSATVATNFYKIDPNLSITLDTKYANQYNAGGNDALIDGIIGTQDFRTGTWQGYSEEDVIATVDLGSIKPINTIGINFLQDQGSWIFYPTEVECLVSTDGKVFSSSETIKIDAAFRDEDVLIKNTSFNIPTGNYRYVKIIAKKMGELPEWHLGYPHDGRSWIFTDEISIN